MYTKTSEASYAKEDIVCYKVMDKSGYNDNEWVTPYRRTPVSNSIVSGEKNFKANSYERVRSSYDYSNSFVITSGFIHTFAVPSKARISARSFSGGKVFACIIPKGAKYYESCNGDCYASKEIKFVKRLTLK